MRLFLQGCCEVFAMLLGSCCKGRIIRIFAGICGIPEVFLARLLLASSVKAVALHVAVQLQYS